MARAAFKFTSSTTLTPVPDCILEIKNNHISIMNKTDGDIEIYIGFLDYPVLIVPSDIGIAYDEFQSQGQMYIKNTTGTGGDVYIHFWKKELY